MRSASSLHSVSFMVRWYTMNDNPNRPPLSALPSSSRITKKTMRLLVIGDSLNSSLVAIVSVDPDALKAWAASEGIEVICPILCLVLTREFKYFQL